MKYGKMTDKTFNPWDMHGECRRRLAATEVERQLAWDELVARGVDISELERKLAAAESERIAMLAEREIHDAYVSSVDVMAAKHESPTWFAAMDVISNLKQQLAAALIKVGRLEEQERAADACEQRCNNERDWREDLQAKLTKAEALLQEVVVNGSNIPCDLFARIEKVCDEIST